MSESNVEKIERIKKFGLVANGLTIEDKLWLIEQTEKAQKLKAENHQYRMKYENTGAVMGRMSQRMLADENKRQKDMLLHLYRYMGMSADHDNKLRKELETFLGGRDTVRKALEEN